MPSRRLFDASALVDVILGTRGEDVPIAVVFDEHILDLTVYEAANALWKIALVRDLLSEDELQDAVSILGRLHRDVRIENPAETELERTMQIACQDGLTFYDASYLAIADRDDLSLVTEDAGLREAAVQRDVAVESVDELVTEP